MQKILTAWTALALILMTASTLTAGETPKLTLDGALAQAGGAEQIVGTPKPCEPGKEDTLVCPPREVPGYEKPLKGLSLSANYYLWSDYIFRGVNVSEYLGEGREKPVHQMDVGAEYKFNDVFGIGGKFFASWATADAELFAGSERNIQELRYSPYIFADVKEIYSRVMLGMNFFNYPNAPSGRNDDMEWYLQVCHNDAWMWKALWPDNEKGVLNPFIFFAQNVDEAARGTALLIGFNHPFEVPGVKYLTINPQFSMAMDNRLVCKLVGAEPTTKMLFLNYGMTVSYSLARALKLPPSVGDITVSGNLYYSQALADYIDDVLYGGMQVGWTW